MGKVQLEIKKPPKRVEVVRLNAEASELLAEMIGDTGVPAGALVGAMIRYVYGNGYEIVDKNDG